ncbi:TIM barrel protein [Patescibacteria group bacterium]
MIKPGIKLGPKNDLHRLENTGAKYCEVWYRIDKPEWYSNYFTFFKKNRINSGLHYWGAVDQAYETNIAYPGEIQEKSIKLIEKCIDVAAQNKCHYVNIHAGARKLTRLDMKTLRFNVDQYSLEVSEKDADTAQKESLIHLSNYASDKGVLFLVETIPAKIHNKDTRHKPEPYYAMTSQNLLKRATQDNISITNDFCHTFSEEFEKPLDQLWKSLWDKTSKLAPYTKLLHINTLVSPYNGTDTHHGITNEDFEIDGIFPTKEKLKEALSLFRDRDDVWAINEPSENHEDNYFSLKELINTL